MNGISASCSDTKKGCNIRPLSPHRWSKESPKHYICCVAEAENLGDKNDNEIQQMLEALGIADVVVPYDRERAIKLLNGECDECDRKQPKAMNATIVYSTRARRGVIRMKGQLPQSAKSGECKTCNK